MRAFRSVMAADTRRMRAGPGKMTLLVLVVLAAAACTTGSDDPSPAPAPEGPAEVRLDAVTNHAAQFDEELDERPAGSQQEFAAASYLTGHLQRFGYEVRLDSVPFKDLVRSTNVVALPPGGGNPAAVVTIAYDTTPSAPALGRDLGLFLELARALRVLEPAHNVQFVALGAELTDIGGGNLGSRALAGELRNAEADPAVIAIMTVPGGGFGAQGSAGDELDRVAAELGLSLSRPQSVPILPVHLRAAENFAEARVPHTIAAGGVEEVAGVLLEHLAR